MHKFANPTNFMRIANAVLPWASVICIVLFAVGLPMALVTSPPDYQQGETVRLMYVHVPSAWISLMVYGVMAAGSAAFLIWRHPMANLAAPGPSRPSARCSPFSRWSPACCGASRCGAPSGCGTRG